MSTVIRASSLPEYADCPRRWAAKTLFKEVDVIGNGVKKSMPSNVGASIGTGMHGGIAFMLTEKMKTGDLGNVAESEDRALGELKTAIGDGTMYDELSPDLNTSEKQVRRMLKAYRVDIAPKVQPISVERRLNVQLGGGFVLSGQSDTQALEPNAIRDAKSGKTHRTHYGQLGSYSLLVRSVHPESPAKLLCVDFVQRVSIKDDQPDAITEWYDQPTAEQAAHATLDHIKRDVTEFRRRLEEGDAPPEHVFLANPSSGLCSPKWCNAFGTDFCREHKKL